MRHRHTGQCITAICLFGMTASAAFGQRPFDLFLDLDSSGNPISLSQCDMVNAGNARLVVLTDTGQLVIVDGFDVVLEDTFVSGDGDVLFEGEQAGFIAFADDGDDTRTLWWVSLNGFVVNVDGFSGLPSVSNLTPFDFIDVDCDACGFWDDPSDCGECSDDDECDDDNVCTDDACSFGVCLHTNNFRTCDDDEICTVGDLCLGGDCVGTPVGGCEPDDDEPPLPPFRITICGNVTAMIFPFMFMMLGIAKLGLISRRNGRRTIARKQTQEGTK